MNINRREMVLGGLATIFCSLIKIPQPNIVSIEDWTMLFNSLTGLDTEPKNWLEERWDIITKICSDSNKILVGRREFNIKNNQTFKIGLPKNNRKNLPEPILCYKKKCPLISKLILYSYEENK